MGINTVEVVNFKNVKFAKFLPLNIGFSKAKFLKDLIPLSNLFKDERFTDFLLESLSVSARLHDKKLVHGDLSLSNFAVSDGNLFLIDLENMRKVASKFKASEEIIDYIHDIHKEARKAKVNLNYRGLFDFYVERVGFSERERRNLEEKFLRFFKERGIDI